MDYFVDEINACTYLFPMQPQNLKFKWDEYHKPGRYCCLQLTCFSLSNFKPERGREFNFGCPFKPKLTGSLTGITSTLFANHPQNLLRNQIYTGNMSHQLLNENGFLYPLNASTLSKQWDRMGPRLQKTVESFHLFPLTENYAPPTKDPWRFG